MLCSHFFKGVFLKSRDWKNDIKRLFSEKMLQKKESKGEKKVVEMRRHWSGSSPKSQFTQHNSHWTCNLALHKAFWGTQSIFFLVKKSQCITTGTLTTPSVVLRFADLPQFLNTLNSVNLSLYHTRQCIESVAPRQFSAHLFVQHHVQNNHRFSILVHPSLPHFSIPC